ncbi:MAG: hypothetical protein NC548_45500 [Lachnospiraceae bacterium]|nr:hypothetical protein [Lachnospiraceae bacterium]
MRENHYAILALSKISQVFTYKISITLLKVQNVVTDSSLPNAKLLIKFETQRLAREKLVTLLYETAEND